MGHSTRVIGISDLVALWVIKIKKSPWSFAHVVRRDQVNKARNVDHTGEYAKGLFIL